MFGKNFVGSAMVVLGLVAMTVPAAAFGHGRLIDSGERYLSQENVQWRSVAPHDAAKFTRCPMSSASEGNANQQNFPVKQYGQTSGGNRC